MKRLLRRPDRRSWKCRATSFPPFASSSPSIGSRAQVRGRSCRRAFSSMRALESLLRLAPLLPLALPLTVAFKDLANAFDDDMGPVGAQPVSIRRELRVQVRREAH